MTMRIFIAVLVVIITYVAYLALTYIDDTVTTGEAYGFKINNTKKETFSKAKDKFKDIDVFVLHPLNKSGFGPHKKVLFDEEDFLILKNRERWTFYFDEEFFDLLKLTFKDDELVTIHRHRKKFELP